ncbi:hypothetical protein [Desulfosarcina sp.]|uniref:hypothetical protein n=1 Tax=Desulfosarcina sp. TaxID=2027861 RepID=UPI0029AFC14C|nr:hypothetical protein [Desulfosarcina sp.]MDX2451852.1 hypothetical protein [Desulfosarcina sp.]MDX2489634.1 hypothetical protein [Desulfosarcina sp.]
MSDVLKTIRDFMEKEGIPGRDGYDLADSTKSFPDGAHWRIEIAGVERATTMEAMIDEAKKRNVTVHRAIATVGGSTYCDFEELKAMAQMAYDEKIELVMVVGHRKGWDAGSKEAATHEGMMQGFRLRGSDNISYHIADIMRNIEAGVRGFLVYDEGVLLILNKMRAEGVIPTETIFKFSVFGGYCSAAGAKVVESMGVNSFNPLSDVSLPILSSIRKTVDIPLDVYVIIVDAFGGMYRAYEAPEIARVAAPVYFKIEPGTSEGDIYKPWVSESFHRDLVREKVKMAQVIQELMGRHAPQLKFSGKGPADLILPVVG